MLFGQALALTFWVSMFTLAGHVFVSVAFLSPHWSAMATWLTLAVGAGAISQICGYPSPISEENGR